MARKIVITSGKGGVGKTTICVNLGLFLAKSAKRVLLIDGDIGLNNLDAVAKVDNLVVFDLIDVLNGKCRAKQAIIESPLNKNLFVLPCAHSLYKSEVSGQSIKAIINTIENLYDFIIIDCPAGIDIGFHRAVSCADEGIVVVSPNLTSVRDADKVLSILKSYNLNLLSVIVNRIRGDLVLSGDMYSAEDIENTLKTQLIGVIPEDDKVLDGLVELSFTEIYKAFKMLEQNVLGKPYKSYNYLKRYTGFWGSIRKELKKRL